MRITVIGAGFVGLVTGAVFADLGNQVWIIDVDKGKIKNLKKEIIPFYEPDLESIVKRNLQSGRLKLTTSYKEAIPEAEIVFVCVGTPQTNGKIDLSYLYSACEQTAKFLKDKTIIVIKSTVPPGINLEIKKLMEGKTKNSFLLASAPEFLGEGRAVGDCFYPDRVVIGVEGKETAAKLLKLYEKIPGERLVCDPISAQLIKYAANAYLATKISFANSLAILCDKLGADVKTVTKGLGLDRRIAPYFLNAGLGYGGSCFPKDVSGLIEISQKSGFDFKILKSTREVNNFLIEYFIEKAERLVGNLKGKKVAVLGLSFKPETSDMREARSLEIIKSLQKKGAFVRASDPVAIPQAKKILKAVQYFSDPYQALKGADLMILVTEWLDYQKLDFSRVSRLMKKPVVLDGRNIYNPNKLRKLGFIYSGVGQ